MPRMIAPKPSDEFEVVLQKPFSGTPTHTITVVGQTNSSASVKVSDHNGSNIIEKTGDLPKDDVEELMRLITQLRGFPSHEKNDIYGLDTKLEFSTFEIQWTNEEEDSASNEVNDVAGETKETFKEVVDSIQALGRQFAKKDNRV